MVETAWRVPAPSPGLFRPIAVIGAANPLWAYFAGAALAGMSWWWMTRWMWAPPGLQPVPAGREAPKPAAEPMPAPTMVEAEGAAFPLGGEGAPVGPVVLEAELAAGPDRGAAAQEEGTAREAAAPTAVVPAPRRPPRPRKPRPTEPKPH